MLHHIVLYGVLVGSLLTEKLTTWSEFLVS